MSGQVFHPGHEELHGVTVVMSDLAGKTYVGRYHEKGPKGIVLHDVAVHDPSMAALVREEWLARQIRFGVEVQHRAILIPAEMAGAISRFSESL